MTSLLEDRYRRALRMLPAAYRQAWEEDMVATFLEQAHAAAPDDPEGVELSSPGVSELASVAALAVRLRLGGPGSEPRHFAWGEALRRVALVGLLAHTVWALVGVAHMLWITQRLPGIVVPADAGAIGYPDQWRALWGLSGLLWLPAYLSLLHGRHRAARLLALLAFAPAVISVVADLAAHGGAYAASRSYGLLFDALPLIALAAFHHDAPPVRARPWLAALPVGVGVVFAASLLTQPAPGHDPLADLPAYWCVGLTAGAVVYLLSVRGTARTPGWPLAFALLATAAFGLRSVTLLDYVQLAAPSPNRSALLVAGAVEAAAALVAATTFAALASRSLRKLPPSTRAPAYD